MQQRAAMDHVISIKTVYREAAMLAAAENLVTDACIKAAAEAHDKKDHARVQRIQKVYHAYSTLVREDLQDAMVPAAEQVKAGSDRFFQLALLKMQYADNLSSQQKKKVKIVRFKTPKPEAGKK
jgi:hypothetical protein